MRHAISYLSTAIPELTIEHINSLLDQTLKKNNALNISGFLICSENNFFQLIEGEKEKISELFSIILEDSRHHSLIKIVDKPVESKIIYNESYYSFITENNQFPSHKVENYLPYIKMLDLNSQQAITRILEAMII